MICPKCSEEGKKSMITMGSGYSTLMGWSPYYDEDGRFHNHNPNRNISKGFCSNGHKLTVESRYVCPWCEPNAVDAVTVKAE